ncbi:maltose acetyltransferase domain-containing protein [Bacillus safensis]|uniref:maltose acetyltransferase domain-containing protein n=1 Tax=Bacillus safensis TaxID=561879 RepID=UPI003981CE9E
MIQGEHYVSSDQTLIADRERARQLTYAYQQTNQQEKRTSILKELLGACGAAVLLLIQVSQLATMLSLRLVPL